MNKPRLVYGQRPLEHAALNYELKMLHEELVEPGLSGPVQHAACFDSWLIRLGTSGAGELVDISGSRGGQDIHRYTRLNEDAIWQAEGPHRLFEEAHFYNLVNIAIRDDLEWTVVEGTN